VTPATLAGGRYALERPLGRGGMAEVMLARDTALDRDVAVKLLAERVRGDRDLRERFLREGRFAARLSHPNVVGVYDSGEEDGRPYIVMECVDGASLAEELGRRGPLAPAEVAELGRQACEGLAHAHARGLVHRDVKPQNLLLRPDGTVKVADFGIARAAGGGATLTQAGTLLGTAAYMAPEVVAGEPAGPAADVYSLGAVLYELVTGEPPQHATTLAELAEQEPPRPPSERTDGIPRRFEETIMRCLARDPEHRPSAAELARDLAVPAAASERPTEVARPAAPSPRRRRDWLVPAALVAVVAATVAAVTLALAATSRDDPPPPERVQPVPAGRTPAEDARNLADWLRANAG
jgi:eukaryotic-like serine/threonine-protein kinase